jgi:hypothetical protein
MSNELKMLIVALTILLVVVLFSYFTSSMENMEDGDGNDGGEENENKDGNENEELMEGEEMFTRTWQGDGKLAKIDELNRKSAEAFQLNKGAGIVATAIVEKCSNGTGDAGGGRNEDNETNEGGGRNEGGGTNEDNETNEGGGTNGGSGTSGGSATNEGSGTSGGSGTNEGSGTTNETDDEDSSFYDDLTSTGTSGNRCDIRLTDKEARCYFNRNLDILNNFDREDIKGIKRHWKKFGCSNGLEFSCRTGTTDSTDSTESTTGNSSTSSSSTMETNNAQLSTETSGTELSAEEMAKQIASQKSNMSVMRYIGSNGKEFVSISRANAEPIVIGPDGSTMIRGGIPGFSSGQGQGDSNQVRMYEHDKYILKTQVVPPVCLSCPGMSPCAYDDETCTADEEEECEETCEDEQEETNEDTTAQETTNEPEDEPQPQMMSQSSQPQMMSQSSQPQMMSQSSQPQMMSQSSQPQMMNQPSQPQMMNQPSQPQMMMTSTQSNQNLGQFESIQNGLMGNKDNYEPQSLLADFSAFSH